MRRRHLTGLLVLAVALGAAAAGTASVTKPQAVPAFTYTFRVVDFKLTATLTYANTAATIRYRLLKPSIAKSMWYLGSRPTNRSAAWKGPYAGPLIDAAADATYTSSDPSCTNTIQYRPSGNKIVQVFVSLEPRVGAKRVTAGVGRIPLAVPEPGEDGPDDFSTKPRPRCGKPVMGHWYQDALSTAPAELITKPRVTLTGRHAEKFTDPGIESIEWTMKVVLQRLSFRKIDCGTHPGC
jgi:hypothetical protein